MKAFLPTLLGALAWTAAAQSAAPKPIFDARLTLKPTSLTAEEDHLLKNSIGPAAGKHWQEVGDAALCITPQEPRAVDVASGAFTHLAGRQRAILYSYCETGHNQDLEGIAIIEDGHLVVQIVFRGAANTAIGAVPDLNGNGLAEIVVASGGSNTGEVWGQLAVIEIAGSEVTAFGHAKTFSDNCGAVEKGCHAEATRVLARSGAKPAFFRERFTRAGSAGTWAKAATLAPLALEEDETEYELLH